MPACGTQQSVLILPIMKTTIFVPGPIFEEAERLALRMKRSRSELYSSALADYLARHDPDSVTEAMNCALARLGSDAGAFVATASRRALKRNEW